MSYQLFEAWRDTPQEPRLSIVIPAYNEAERILPTLAAMAVVVSRLQLPWELIVSDDGSQDSTADLVNQLPWANLVLVRHANTGKGGAVRRGVIAARGRYILFADADNSTPIEELPRLIAKLDQGFDLAIGSRAAEGAKEENKSALRHFVSWCLRTIAGSLSGVNVKDSQCGFKLFHKEAASELFARQTMFSFSFDLELLYLANKLGYNIAEVPVRWFDAPGSKVDSIRDSVTFIRDLFALRRLDANGVYDL